MTSFGRTPYKIRSTEISDVISECDRIFALLSDRLDKMEGFRGTPELFSALTTNFDLVCTDSEKGLVLKDNANPANYWRLTITGASLAATNIGRNYK